MSTRTAPPPRALEQDTTRAEQAIARRLWDGRAGHEVSEEEAIAEVVGSEYPKANVEQRGALRSDGKARLSWLVWTGVLLQTEPGQYKWAETFPARPTQTRAEVEARDNRQREQEDQRAADEAAESLREIQTRASPNRPLEDRLTAVETESGALREEMAALRLELRRDSRPAENASTDARLAAAGLTGGTGRQETPVQTGREVEHHVVHANTPEP